MSPTRGTLIRLRESRDFIQNGLSILKLKRDRLAEELNMLLKDMSRRKNIEDQLMQVYTKSETTTAMLGYVKVQSTARSIGSLKISADEHSVMNVIVPHINVEKKPSLDGIQDLSLFDLATRINRLIEELVLLASVEASIERIAHELTLVNRKVNAIEKVVIPNYSSQIKYIEEFLSDEELEEFTRIKHIKAMSKESKI
jgi:V/A-type H+-transporting ATPase subunit D